MSRSTWSDFRARAQRRTCCPGKTCARRAELGEIASMQIWTPRWKAQVMVGMVCWVTLRHYSSTGTKTFSLDNQAQGQVEEA